MDPGTALALSAGSSVMGGLAGRAEAKGEQRQAQINSFIARTRAIQTDTVARQGIEDDLGETRAALAANGQARNVSTLELLNEIRDVRGRERRIAVGNEMTRAADYKMQGRNAAARGRSSMMGGFIKAGPSLYELAQL